MSRSAQENIWVRRVRTLTQILILSGTLNIGFIATFAYFVLRENDPVELELKPVEKLSQEVSSNEKILRAYSVLPFQELLLRLESKELVEEGYMKRDLALGCLVAFHHFNLERALGGLLLQQRKVSFENEEGEETMSLIIFPGLADYQFQAIIHYAKTEKWPLSSQGLFFALKRQEERRDSSLLEAFSLTPEFHAVFTLFSRSGIQISKEILIALLTEGEWESLERFFLEQRQAQNLTPERRRDFLLAYIEADSKVALHLLFRIDKEFVAKRFSDEQIISLLEMLDDKIVGLEAFAKELLLSPRSDAVHHKSALKLYSMKGESVPEPYDHKKTLRRFIPEAVIEEENKPPPPVQSVLPAPKPKKIYHTIEFGDSLWKIAQKYNTTVDELVRCNKLDSDRLRVGKQLEIPQKP